MIIQEKICFPWNIIDNALPLYGNIISFSIATSPIGGGGSQWALMPAGSPSSMPLQQVPGLPWAVLSVNRGWYTFKGTHMRGWHPYQVPNNLSWLLWMQRSGSLTPRPSGLPGSSLCHADRAQSACWETSFWLLESVIVFLWSLPKALGPEV